MTISVILPAYQEAENLKIILPQLKDCLKSIGEPFEILIIDTMEPMDDTKAVCETQQVRYIPREGGNLYGDAIRTGFVKAEGQYIVVMDADGSHNVKDIAKFYNEMKSEQYDLIIGSRYCKGGYTDNSLVLKTMSWMLNVAYRFMFELKVKDVSDSYRMYKAIQIKNLRLECNNFDIVEEILISLKFNYMNFRIKEVPIEFNKRVAGESKRDLKKFILSYLQTIKRLMKIKRDLSKKQVKNNKKE